MRAGLRVKMDRKQNATLLARVLMLGVATAIAISACAGSSSGCEGQGACMIYFYSDS